MRNFVAFGVVAVVLAGSSVAQAQDTPPTPMPQKEHEWLKQLEGEWETHGECVMEPGQPPITCKGTESTRVLGGFWVVSEHRGEFQGTPVTGIMTVGYDAKKKKFIGTWVCSMCEHMCEYEGTLDEAGKVLTLHTVMPHFTDPSKMMKCKDVLELKGKDHRQLKSYILGDDGKWVEFMTMDVRRKK